MRWRDEAPEIDEPTRKPLKKHDFKLSTSRLNKVRDWRLKSMDEIAPKLKEWKISVFWSSKSQLHPASNDEARIIKQIEAIHFPRLKELIVF